MPYIRGQRGLGGRPAAPPEGREAFRALVRTADVVLDNYRAGVLGRLGIDYDRLKMVKPDIVSVSITGFGPSSPEPAFDPLLQARSGMMVSQGGDSEPVFMTVAVNDVTTATLAVLGTVLALFHRLRSGARAGGLAVAGRNLGLRPVRRAHPDVGPKAAGGRRPGLQRTGPPPPLL